MQVDDLRPAEGRRVASEERQGLQKEVSAQTVLLKLSTVLGCDPRCDPRCDRGLGSKEAKKRFAEPLEAKTSVLWMVLMCFDPSFHH